MQILKVEIRKKWTLQIIYSEVESLQFMARSIFEIMTNKKFKNSTNIEWSESDWRSGKILHWGIQ